MSRFISEPIEPLLGSFDTAAMSRGEPGLPAGFVWRGRTVRIVGCERRWAELRPEATGGELYLRRHYWTLDMDDGTTWTVYCLRRPPRPRRLTALWYLYTIDRTP